MVFSFIPKKYIVILGLVAALGVALWFWRSEVYNAAQDAYAALVSAATIEVNEQSQKDSENVRKEIQSFNARQLDNRLCKLGIVQDSQSSCQ